MAGFDASPIGTIGDRVTGPIADAPFKAMQLGDLINKEQISKIQLKDEQDEQNTYGALKGFIETKKLDLSKPEDQNKLAAEATRLSPKVGMKLQREMLQQQDEAAKVTSDMITVAKERTSTLTDAVTPFLETARKLSAGDPSNGIAPLSDQEIDAKLLPQMSEVLKRLKDAKLANGEPLLTPDLQQGAGQLLSGNVRKNMETFVMGSSEAMEKLNAFEKQRMEAAKAVHENRETVDLMVNGKLHKVIVDKDGNKIKDLGETKEPSALYSQGSPEEQQATAQGIAKYQLAPPNPRSANYRQTMAEVLKLNPKYDAKTWRARNDAVTRFDTGKQGDAVRSLNVAVQHLTVLEDAFRALDNGDTRAFNAARAAYLEQTGDELPSNVEAAADFVGNEVSKAAMGAGVSGALADREGVKKNITTSVSQKQSSGQISTYRKLLAGQLRGLKKQYESSTGLDDFNEKLDPETTQTLESTTPSAAGSGAAPPTAAAAGGAGAVKVTKWKMGPDGKLVKE